MFDGKESAVLVFLLRARASVSLGIRPGPVEEARRDGPRDWFPTTVWLETWTMPCLERRQAKGNTGPIIEAME